MLLFINSHRPCFPLKQALDPVHILHVQLLVATLDLESSEEVFALVVLEKFGVLGPARRKNGKNYAEATCYNALKDEDPSPAFQSMHAVHMADSIR